MQNPSAPPCSHWLRIKSLAEDYIRPSAALGLVRQDTRTDRRLLIWARPVQVGLRSTDRRMRTPRDNVWLMSGPGYASRFGLSVDLMTRLTRDSDT
jgi:hypothetical protein